MGAIIKEHVETGAAAGEGVEEVEIVGVMREDLDARLLDLRPDFLDLFHGVDTIDGSVRKKVVPELQTSSITDADLENILGGLADRTEELLINVEVTVACVLVGAGIVYEGLEDGHRGFD